MADAGRENASPTLLVCPLSVIRLSAVLSVKTWASQVVPVVKNLPAKAGDIRNTGLIPESERSPRRNGSPPQRSCLGSPMDRGAWWAAVHGVTQSQSHTAQCVCPWAISGA